MSPSLPNRRVFLSSALTLVPAARLLRGEQATLPVQTGPGQTGAQATFSADVKVVNVLATVREKDGKIVKDLTKESFTVLEDGRPQTIRYFVHQSDLPLTLGLLVDTSMSERRMIPAERTASYKFLEQVLRPEKDKAFLIHFDHDVELLQDLTSSRELLEKALDLVQGDQPRMARNNPDDDPNGTGQGGGNSPSNGGGYPRSGGGGGWPGMGGGGMGGRRGGGGYPRGGGGGRRSRVGTAFYDAIYLASDEILKKQTGRKAVILLTDGEDNGSKISMAEAITVAQRADTMGYSVRIADEEIGSMTRGWNGGRGGGGTDRPDGKKILKEISKQTGGGYFEFGKKKSLDDIYAEIEDELRNQYSIGYTPDKPATAGDAGYRKIELKVNRKNVTVQSRDGYYA